MRESQAVSMRGQVTLKRELLRHLGVEPGGQIVFDKMPDGEVRLRAARPGGGIDGFIGLLAGKSKRTLSIEEMNEIAASGWAGER